jgi:hypothetical protein
MEDLMSLLKLGLVRAALAALAMAALPGLASAQSCPDVGLTGQAINQSAGALTGGMPFPVVAGGNIDISLCSEVPGGGFVAQAPDFELSLSGSAGMDLQLSVTAGCDATLLVNDALGAWQYADDNDGTTNPRMVLSGAQDGTYDIWIGTFSSATCDATLNVQTFAAGTAPPLDAAVPTPGGGTCPDVSLSGQLLSYDMATLATPQVSQVVAGGDIDLFFCDQVSASGYVIQSPDFELDLSGNSAGGDVTVGVAADCDAILLINDATGQWLYNDDANGTFDPEIVLTGALDGIYDIWVGTLGAESCDATLTISGPAAAGGGKAPAAPAPAPAPEPEPEPAAGGKAPVAPAPTTDPAPAPSPDDTGMATEPDPGNMTAYRADVGAVLTFEVTGSTDGFVWGSDVYTDDSDLSTAAVHAGILADGETGIVSVEMLGPQTGFQASDRNGVPSSAFGSWGGSYGFIAG